MADTGVENVEYYDELASVYHLFFHDLERNMEEEGGWLDVILRASGARSVLDASCGTGRQAIPLAKRGYQVTAADPSERMLRLAREEAGRQDLPIDFIQAPFVELPRTVETTCDAVIAMGNGLCNLRDIDGIREALRALSTCCRTGGICVIGIKDFEAITRERPRFQRHQVAVTPAGQAILFELWTYDDPVLISTAFLTRQTGTTGQAGWHTLVAETREYMLLPEEVTRTAGEAGFRAVYRLHHPSEAAFLLLA